MSTLPQIAPKFRPPRLHLDGTPAVLRFEDGERISGELEVVSVTGGLLSLSQSLSRGVRVQLMFVTVAGSVMAGAELLEPLTKTLQPFRFVSLDPKDRRRLESVIPVSVYHDITEPAWMKKLRAASENRYEPPRRITRFAIRAGLLTLGLICALCLLYFPLMKHIGR
jgi:hypothetical protein